MASPFHIVERTSVEALQHYLRKHNISLPEGFLDDALTLIIQSIMEIEVSQLIDASRYERNGSRRAYRNGYRESAWLIENGNIPLRIPKLRSGSYYPSFMDNPQAEVIIHDLILQSFVKEIDFESVSIRLDLLDIDAHPSQIATLEESIYDLVTQYRERLIIPQRIHLDFVPVEDEGRKRYLALAFDDDELLDHDITSEADDDFWQDFVRRIDGRSIQGVEYVAVSRVHTVVRYTDTNSPNMALVA